ncbi:hypothetical protein D047_2840A, partial [Vibrio parahaemolyticus VPTS-2010_2]
MGKHW